MSGNVSEWAFSTGYWKAHIGRSVASGAENMRLGRAIYSHKTFEKSIITGLRFARSE
jgi:hypothetical protein